MTHDADPGRTDVDRHTDRPLAIATRQLDTERVVVTEWRFPPGGHTGWHVHAFDYVIVPMTTGELLIETGDGPLTSQLVTGQTYGRDRGAEHDVINGNPHEFVFIEIEIKP
jgi:quercetin dioxygenase-like cupin family protein